MNLAKILTTIILLTNSLFADHDIQEFELTDELTNRSIRIVYGEQNNLKAFVVGKINDQSVSANVPVLFSQDRGWEHNDSNLTSQRIHFAAVQVGHDLLQQEAPYQGPHKYSLKEETEERAEELTLGKTLYVFKVLNYERADGSIYKKFTEVLYRVRMEDMRTPMPDICTTASSERYFRCRGFHSKKNTRYTMHVYGQTKVDRLIRKLDVNTDDEIGEPEILDTLYELKFKSSYKSNNNEGQSLPAKYKII